METRANSRASEEADQEQAKQDAQGQEDAEIAQLPGPGLQEEQDTHNDEQEAHGQEAIALTSLVNITRGA